MGSSFTITDEARIQNRESNDRQTASRADQHPTSNPMLLRYSPGKSICPAQNTIMREVSLLKASRKTIHPIATHSRDSSQITPS
jgi:hypothetical protein